MPEASAEIELARPTAELRRGNPARGIGFMVAATLMFCLGDAFMKLAAATLPNTETTFFRALVGLIVAGTIAAVSGSLGRWRQLRSGAVVVRAGADAAASLLFQAALPRMQFADIQGINQLQTLTLTAGSALFLRERVGWYRWSAIAFGLLGGLLIVKPGTSAFNPWAVVALAALMSSTTREITTRRIAATLPVPLIMVTSSVVICLASLAASVIQHWSRPGPYEFAMLVGAGLSSSGGHFCMINAIRSAEVSVVAPFRYAAMIWALILGYALWGNTPDRYSQLGIVMIAVAGLYTFHRERQLKIERRQLRS